MWCGRDRRSSRRALQRAREDLGPGGEREAVSTRGKGRTDAGGSREHPPVIARSALAGACTPRARCAATSRIRSPRPPERGRRCCARGQRGQDLRAEYAWTNIRTQPLASPVGVEGSAITVKGFSFDTLEGRLGYNRPNGEIQLAVRQGDDATTRCAARFVVGRSVR